MSDHRRHNYRIERSGFTLVELLIVLVMIAVLSCTLAANLAGRQDRQALHIAGKDLAAAVRYCRRQADLRQVAHRLAFGGPSSSYRVEISTPGSPDGFIPAAGQAGRYHRLPQTVCIRSVVAEGGEQSPMPEALLFAPAGEGFSGTVQLVGRNGDALAVEVADGATQVRIVEKQP
jgi:prepilin-type N-terminal cleavage/methylation domain-containing protein